MGLDIDEICNFMQIMNSSITVPLNLTIGIYILWQIIGPSSLTLIAVMLVLGPLTTIIMRRTNTLQSQQMKLKDKRMEQISEILNNIKLLKLFGWEKPFIDRITETRHKELKKLRSLGYWLSVIDVLWVMAPMIVAGSCFTVYLLTTTNVFNAKTAFVSLSVFNLLRFPMAILPSVITRCIRAIVSFKRIRKFFNAEELINNNLNMKNLASNKNSLIIKNATYTWSLGEEPILKDIDITIPKGSLIAIVGKVGSGKSSLFSAILGDMYQTNGMK
jgi:ATP-binding cassette, subfamily C (CFTR/MRP), member 1